LTKEQAIPFLRNVPTEIKSHILGRPGEHVMSVITFPFSIQGTSDADMEDAEHDLRETLEDGKLYIKTKGARGTRAVLEMQSNNAAARSYKTVFWAEFVEDGGREILGAAIKESYIRDLQMRLYCEAYWRPSTAVTLGPNEIYCPSFEEDGNADGTADNWTALNVPVLAMETTIVLHGCDSQKVTTNMVGEGIASTTMVAPAAPANDAVAYAWVCRPAAGTDIIAVLRDTSVGADRATATFNAATTTATGKSGQTWKRLELIATNNIVPTNNHQLWVYSVADTVTDWYVDKCFWKWDTTTIPDEWCDRYSVYNHKDSDANHQNYFDIDDLKGDIDAPVCLVALGTGVTAFYEWATTVARRTRGSPSCLTHIREAEAFPTLVNWASAGDPNCSNGNRLTNSGAVTSGSAEWQIASPGIDEKGRFRVIGCVKTDDEINTSWRFGYKYTTRTGEDYTYSLWKTVPANTDWQWLDFGSMFFDPTIRDGITIDRLIIRVEYQKQSGDLVEFDFLMLLPEDEIIATFEPGASWVNASDQMVYDASSDFEYLALENTGEFMRPIYKKGDITLRPEVENRLIFGWHDVISTNHHWYISFMLRVSFKYLPQFISPLE